MMERGAHTKWLFTLFVGMKLSSSGAMVALSVGLTGTKFIDEDSSSKLEYFTIYVGGNGRLLNYVSWAVCDAFHLH